MIQHVSLEGNVSGFPFIFFNLSGFSTLLATTCLLRGLFSLPNTFTMTRQ